MKKALILLAICSLTACKNEKPAPTGPSFKIIQLKTTAGTVLKTLKEGDVLKSSFELSLLNNESIVLGEENQDKVLEVRGPQKVTLSDIDDLNLKSFSKKHFQFIEDKLDMDENRIKKEVFSSMGRPVASISRSGEFDVDVVDGESLVHNELVVNINKPRDVRCQVRFLLEEDQIAEIYTENKFIYDLGEFRDQGYDQQLELKFKCGDQRYETEVILVSKGEQDKLLKEEKELIDNAYPEISLIGFYIDNGMMRRAKRLIDRDQTGSPFIEKLKKLYD